MPLAPRAAEPSTKVSQKDLEDVEKNAKASGSRQKRKRGPVPAAGAGLGLGLVIPLLSLR